MVLPDHCRRQQLAVVALYNYLIIEPDLERLAGTHAVRIVKNKIGGNGLADRPGRHRCLGPSHGSLEHSYPEVLGVTKIVDDCPVNRGGSMWQTEEPTGKREMKSRHKQ